MMLLSVFTRHKCLVTRIKIVDLSSCRTIQSLTVPIQELSLTKTCPLRKPEYTLKPSTIVWRRFSKGSTCFLSKDDYQEPDLGKNKQDKVPEKYKLVYESDISTYAILMAFCWLCVVMFTSSVVVVMVYIFGYETPEYLYKGEMNIKYIYTGEIALKMSKVVPTSIILSFIVIMSPIVRLHNNLIIRMYHNPTTKDFIAILRKNFFQRETISFKMNDAEGNVRTSTRINYANFRIKGKKCHVYEKDFAKFKHLYLYNKWFGYDDQE